MNFIKIWNPVSQLHQSINLDHIIEFHFDKDFTCILTTTGMYAADGDITGQIAKAIKIGGGQYTRLEGE